MFCQCGGSLYYNLQNIVRNLLQKYRIEMEKQNQTFRFSWITCEKANL